MTNEYLTESNKKKSLLPIVLAFTLGIILAFGGGATYLHFQKLQNELAQTKAELESTKTALTTIIEEKKQIQASKEIADSLLELANEQLAKKPDIPITVSYRQAVMGPGLVAQFTNTSDRFISVIATFNNPTTGDHKSLRLDLAPKVAKEIGHMEGWAAASGDQITIQHNDYEALNAVIR